MCGIARHPARAPVRAASRLLSAAPTLFTKKVWQPIDYLTIPTYDHQRKKSILKNVCYNKGGWRSFVVGISFVYFLLFCCEKIKFILCK
jgi:hypothetical protein